MIVARRERLRQAVVAFGAVAVVGIPFWLTDLVLAGRFDVGVGGRGAKLGGPWAIVTYLWQTAGDFSTGRWPALVVVLVLALVGLATVRFETRAIALCAVGVPVAAFLAARLGGSTSPESRHLIFVLPFFAILVAAGILRSTRRAPAAGVALIACLVVLEVAWAWHRTPQLFDWEPNKRQATRAQAERFLAATSTSGRHPLRLRAALPRRLGAEPRRSRRRSFRGPTRSSRSARSPIDRSRSAAASGSSTRASGTTSARGSRSRTAIPGRPASSRRASSARSS